MDNIISNILTTSTGNIVSQFMYPRLQKGSEYILNKLKEHLASVKQDEIAKPDEDIFTSAIFAGACVTNEELRELYINLLKKAIHKKHKDHVHPAYVEIIKQISPREAELERMIVI